MPVERPPDDPAPADPPPAGHPLEPLVRALFGAARTRDVLARLGQAAESAPPGERLRVAEAILKLCAEEGPERLDRHLAAHQSHDKAATETA